MKTAYELAMERLQKQAPSVTLTPEQKARLSELETEYKAKLADREIFLQGQMAKAVDTGDAEAHQQLERQLAADRKNLHDELEAKKEKIRQSKG